MKKILLIILVIIIILTLISIGGIAALGAWLLDLSFGETMGLVVFLIIISILLK